VHNDFKITGQNTRNQAGRVNYSKKANSERASICTSAQLDLQKGCRAKLTVADQSLSFDVYDLGHMTAEH
jgi:hypothetical protein